MVYNVSCEYSMIYMKDIRTNMKYRYIYRYIYIYFKFQSRYDTVNAQAANIQNNVERFLMFMHFTELECFKNW